MVPQARHQGGTAECDVSGVLSISSHTPSRLLSKPSQPLPACVDQLSLLQPMQQAAARATARSGRIGTPKAQGHQHSTVRKAGVKVVSAGRLSQSAGKGQNTSCPSLQDIVGIAMGHDLSSKSHLQGKDRTTDTQKAGAVVTPTVRGCFAKAPCRPVQPVDQQLRCTAEGFHSMLSQDDVCNPSSHQVGKPGTDMQVPSTQPARRVGKVSCSAVHRAKAHMVVSSDRCEGHVAPALETAGTRCRQFQ